MFSLQRLLGKEDRFFELLEASAAETRSSVQALERFLKTPGQSSTLDDFVLSRQRENRIYNEISESLAGSFVTSLEKEDIEALSLSFYRIPKVLEKVAEKVQIAPHLLKGFDMFRQVAMLDKAAGTLIQMVQELKGGAALDEIKGQKDELQRIEGDADKLMLEVFGKLYSQKHDPLAVIFLKDLFELMEKAFDLCRDAGNVINNVVLKNS